jgi:Group XII secretory phospholipase A2 precursor (PLA2G12)
MLKLSIRKMLISTTSFIVRCTFFGCITIFSLPLYEVKGLMAQSLPAQEEISKLQGEISRQGKSLEDVNRAMRDRFPSSDFPYYEGPNGCSYSPDSNWFNSGSGFKSACDTHDRCYATIRKSKDTCDDNFKNDMDRICAVGVPGDACRTAAKLYYGAVIQHGSSAYATAQKQQREYIKSIYAWLSGIAGIWDSTEGFITFKQSGSNVSATYTQDNGTIEGNISDNVLTGYWSENSSLRRCSVPRNGRYHWGKIRFIFKSSSFRGLWSYCDREPNMRWRGVKSSS